MSLIIRRVEEQVVQQRIRDGYINATAMCKAVANRRKVYADYARSKTTKEFLSALSSDK